MEDGMGGGVNSDGKKKIKLEERRTNSPELESGYLHSNPAPFVI